MKAGPVGLLVMGLALSGCGAWAKHNAASQLEDSNAAYKECLTQAGGDATKCSAQKQAFQADLETYEALRGKRLKTSN